MRHCAKLWQIDFHQNRLILKYKIIGGFTLIYFDLFIYIILFKALMLNTVFNGHF